MCMAPALELIFFSSFKDEGLRKGRVGGSLIVYLLVQTRAIYALEILQMIRARNDQEDQEVQINISQTANVPFVN
jgi:hypothetical protein